MIEQYVKPRYRIFVEKYVVSADVAMAIDDKFLLDHKVYIFRSVKNLPRVMSIDDMLKAHAYFGCVFVFKNGNTLFKTAQILTANYNVTRANS